MVRRHEVSDEWKAVTKHGYGAADAEAAAASAPSVMAIDPMVLQLIAESNGLDVNDPLVQVLAQSMMVNGLDANCLQQVVTSSLTEYASHCRCCVFCCRRMTARLSRRGTSDFDDTGELPLE